MLKILGVATALFATSAAAQSPAPVGVEQSSLVKDAFSTGTLSRGAGSLGGDLWRGARPEVLADLVAQTPTRPASPSIGAAARRLLLTTSDAPVGTDARLGGAKLLALARLGFIEETRTIASLSDAPDDEALTAEALATADLLAGEIDAACKRDSRVKPEPGNRFWSRLRVLCYAEADELDAAELALSLLREEGSLAGSDDALFGAIVAGAKSAPPAPATDAVQLAALRMLKTFPSSLRGAQAGVLRAVAKDQSAPWPARLGAAVDAASRGAISGADLDALFSAAPSNAGSPAAETYQLVKSMNAPALLRDRSARIAEALQSATNFPDAFARAVLYADEIAALDGALVTPREAETFAVARMAIGDSDGAVSWLKSSRPAGPAPADADGARLIEATRLLAALDPAAAKGLADGFGMSLAPASIGQLPGASDAAAQIDLAGIADAVLEAAISGIKGQAGLAALAASEAADAGDPVAAVFVHRGLAAAGLTDLARRRAFETAWRAQFSETEAPSLLPASFDGLAGGTDASPTPSRKPKSRR